MSKSQITNFKLQISNVKTRIGNWTLPAGRQELEIINSVRGFTLIELLIIFAISSIVIGISVNSFNSYNNSQIYNQSLSDVQNFLVTARSRAISQLKPAGCGVTPLDGFEVSLTVPGQDYVQNAVCGATRILIERKKLPSQISFVSGSASSILFDVGTGIVQIPGQIAIAGLGKSSTISIDKIGVEVK